MIRINPAPSAFTNPSAAETGGPFCPDLFFAASASAFFLASSSFCRPIAAVLVLSFECPKERTAKKMHWGYPQSP
ncbi:MAG: hypothetical protein KBH06_01720 [Spirochaetes bacterium]|nr:hypothetical protein [Spirochaetota bacterium]